MSNFSPVRRGPTILRYSGTAIRQLVTAGLLWVLVSRIDIGHAADLVSRLSPLQLILAIVALAATVPINTVRWRIIIGLESKPPNLFALMKILLVGLFFNQVLPTGIGGDAVRAWQLQKLGIGLGAAIRSILLDRAAGYCIFVLLYACGLPLLLAVIVDAQQRLAVIAVLAAASGGLFALLIMDFMPGFLSRLPMMTSLATLSRQARDLCRNSRQFTTILALSSISTGLTILCAKFLADGLDVRLSYVTWLAIMPPVILIQLVPVSLAGWGIRETAFVVMLAGFGVPAENALTTSLLFGLCQIVNALPGGAVWLFAFSDIGAPRGRSARMTAGAETIAAARVSRLDPKA